MKRLESKEKDERGGVRAGGGQCADINRKKQRGKSECGQKGRKQEEDQPEVKRGR